MPGCEPRTGAPPVCGSPQDESDPHTVTTALPRWRRRVWRGAGYAARIAALLSLLLLLSAGWWLPALGAWLAQPRQPGPVDAIVVLGGGHPRRSEHGIALYQRGLAAELWFTGDVARRNRPRSFAQLAADQAIAEGAPPAAVHLLRTRSTWEDGAAIAQLAQQRHIEHLLIVTDWHHSRRALCSVRRRLAGSGITVVYDAPPPGGPDRWWQSPGSRAAVASEVIKLGYYWWRYGLAPWRC